MKKTARVSPAWCRRSGLMKRTGAQAYVVVIGAPASLASLCCLSTDPLPHEKCNLEHGGVDAFI
jgi:hypothetical protein